MKNFEQILQLAKNQTKPQQLLFVFANALNQNDAKLKYSSGTITPIMCVNKAPKEIADFTSLVIEADTHNQQWNMIFISSFENEDATEPTTDQIDQKLKLMVKRIQEGNQLSNFVILDRNQNIIYIA